MEHNKKLKTEYCYLINKYYESVNVNEDKKRYDSLEKLLLLVQNEQIKIVRDDVNATIREASKKKIVTLYNNKNEIVNFDNVKDVFKGLDNGELKIVFNSDVALPLDGTDTSLLDQLCEEILRRQRDAILPLNHSKSVDCAIITEAHARNELHAVDLKIIFPRVQQATHDFTYNQGVIYGSLVFDDDENTRIAMAIEELFGSGPYDEDSLNKIVGGSYLLLY